jgi:hypothetical protein
MPAVSINLTDEAYALYKRHREFRDGSRFVSAAIIHYRDKEENLPMLRTGDRRMSVSGDELEWFEGEGWRIVDE